MTTTLNNAEIAELGKPNTDKLEKGLDIAVGVAGILFGGAGTALGVLEIVAETRSTTLGIILLTLAPVVAVKYSIHLWKAIAKSRNAQKDIKKFQKDLEKNLKKTPDDLPQTEA